MAGRKRLCNATVACNRRSAPHLETHSCVTASVCARHPHSRASYPGSKSTNATNCGPASGIGSPPGDAAAGSLHDQSPSHDDPNNLPQESLGGALLSASPPCEAAPRIERLRATPFRPDFEGNTLALPPFSGPFGRRVVFAGNRTLWNSRVARVLEPTESVYLSQGFQAAFWII